MMQGKSEGILPGQVPSNSVRGLLVSQPFYELEDGDQGETSGIKGGLSGGREERGELGIRVEQAELIGDMHEEVTLGEGGSSSLLGIFGNDVGSGRA